MAEVAKKHGISEVTIYAWRKRFGALEAVDVKRLRQLELENGRLKKLVAERDLDIEILKEVAAYTAALDASIKCINPITNQLARAMEMLAISYPRFGIAWRAQQTEIKAAYSDGNKPSCHRRSTSPL